MKLLITQALPSEYVEVRIPGVEVEHVYTGIGKVKAAFCLTDAIHRLQPDAVINIGTAGTLCHQVGDIFVCTRFVDRDLQKVGNLGIDYRLETLAPATVFSWDWRQAKHGVCNTGDSFLTELIAVEGDIVDMEAYAQAQVCVEMGLPFVAVKYVTDVIGQNSVKHWEDKLADARREVASYFQSLVPVTSAIL